MERNKVLDTTKYILIMLVVVGHFMEPTKYSNSVTQHLFCLIYSFHMPLFVWTSGYFYKRRTIGEEIRKCIPLFEVCILSHIGYLLLYKGHLSLGNFVHFGSDPSWYLLSLVFWRISSTYLLRFSIKKILVISIIIDALAFIILKYGTLMSIGRTISFYPFFLLGYYMKDKMHLVTQRYRKQTIVLGMLSIAVIFGCASKLLIQIEFQRTGIMELLQYANGSNIYQVYLLRYATLLCSIFISGLVLILINEFSSLHILSKYGGTTLFIYYIQTLMFAVIGHSHISLLQSLLLAAVTIPTLTYLAKTKYAKYILNPVCNIVSYPKPRAKK